MNFKYSIRRGTMLSGHSVAMSQSFMQSYLIIYNPNFKIIFLFQLKMTIIENNIAMNDWLNDWIWWNYGMSDISSLKEENHNIAPELWNSIFHMVLLQSLSWTTIFSDNRTSIMMNSAHDRLNYRYFCLNYWNRNEMTQKNSLKMFWSMIE